MCEQCVQAWVELHPQLKKWPGWEDLTADDDRAYDIMFGYTGFPIVDAASVREQLQYLCDHGPEATMNHIIESIDKGMEEARAWRARQQILHRKWVRARDGGWTHEFPID